MNPGTSPPPAATVEDVYALIEALHETEQRLAELTGGEVDTVAARDGRTFLLQRAQERLRLSEAAKQAAILNALPAHIALLDTQGVIISVNEAWRQFARANRLRGPEYGIGVNYLEICDSAREDGSAEAHQVAEGIRSVLGGGEKSFSIEYSCRSPKEERWFLLTVTPLADERTQGAVVMHSNITERRRTQVALAQSEAGLHRAQLMAKLSHVIAGPDGSFERWSDTLPQLIGVEPAQLPRTTRAWLDILHPDDRSLFRDKAIEAGVTTLRVELEYRVRRADGQWIHIRQTMEPLKAEGDAAAGPRWFNTLQDVTLERQIEESLRASELRFRQMAENIHDVFFLQNLECSQIYYVSPAYEQIWGRTCESLYANPASWADSIHPDDLNIAFTKLRESRNTGFDYEYRIVRPDGGVRWIHVRGFPILDDAGNPYRTAGVASDITQRKQASDELRESERRFSAMFGNVELVSLMLDREARITYCNDYLLQLTGWRREEVIGRDWFELFIPHGRDNLKEVFSALLADLPSASHHENEILTRSGGLRLIQWNNTVLRSAAGEVIGTASIGEDVTHRKEAEAALRESEERFRATFEQAAAGMGYTTLEGRYVRVNQRFCDIVGYTRDELLARTFQDITHPDDLERDLLAQRQLLAGELQTLAREKRYLHKDGSVVWIDLTVSMLREPSGEPKYLIAVVQDITARKQLEQELFHAQRMEGVGQLAGGIAHDFNNLLTVISGRSHLALEKLQPADPLRRDLDLIQKTAKRAAALTRQLLAFSRKQVLQPRVVDPNDMVDNSTNLLKRLIGENIELVFVPAPAIGRVRVDPGQLEQVIINLAVNARDAMPGGGRLTIETSNITLDAGYAARHVGVTSGPYVMLAVSDGGVGMDAPTRARIFEPFFTTKGPGKGTGLGLATVYGIVKQSSGHIRVYSEPGVGTVFKIYLPRTDAAPEAEPSGDTTLPRGTETILLVEDEAEVRALAREVLEGLGYTLLEATNAAEAVLIAERHVGLINLLLTDVVMPRMSGRALAEAVTAVRPETTVLFMSGYTDDAIVRHGVLEAGVQLLEKPFTLQTLAVKVRAVLDRSSIR
jgi:two-component system, cell cycle sensor histidine kinase and response regulator CckA